MLKEPRCSERECKYFEGFKIVKNPKNTVDGFLVCKAFPKKGIPHKIAYGNNKHSKPVPDQGNDIVFEERKKK